MDIKTTSSRVWTKFFFSSGQNRELRELIKARSTSTEGKPCLCLHIHIHMCMCVRADAHLVDVSWRRNFFCSRVRLFLAVSSTQRSSGFSFLLSRRLYASMRAPTLFQRCRCFRPSWWKGKKKGCEKRDANLRYPSTCACFEGNLMPICSSDRWASRKRIHHEFESFHRKRSHFDMCHRSLWP